MLIYKWDFQLVLSMGHVCSKLPSAMGCGCSVKVADDKNNPTEVGCNLNAFEVRPYINPYLNETTTTYKGGLMALLWSPL